MYSRAPKSGRPDFGAFENPPVPKRPVFRCSFDNRTILSGYWTSGSFQFQRPVIGRPVPTVFNRTSDSRKPDITSGFQTFQIQNQFQTGSKPVPNWFGTGFVSDVRLKTV